MSEDPKTAKASKAEFVCALCTRISPILYGWLRCWDCYQAAITRDGRATPTICLACCREKHARY